MLCMLKQPLQKGQFRDNGPGGPRFFFKKEEKREVGPCKPSKNGERGVLGLQVMQAKRASCLNIIALPSGYVPFMPRRTTRACLASFRPGDSTSTGETPIFCFRVAQELVPKAFARNFIPRKSTIDVIFGKIVSKTEGARLELEFVVV